MHEGQALNKAAKTSRLGIVGLVAAMGIPRSSYYYAIKDAILDDDFKKNALKALGLNYDEVFGQVSNRTSLREAFDLGAFNDDDPLEIDREKEYIDLGNGSYRLKVPLINHVASMGYLHGYADPGFIEELPEHFITVRHVPRGVYRSFVARGDSMRDGTERSILPNSIVTGRVINQELYRHSKLHLHKFQVYIIVHREGIMIKEITAHDVSGGTLTIHSWNPDKKQYPDQVLDMSEVLQILNVVKVERDF